MGTTIDLSVNDTNTLNQAILAADTATDGNVVVTLDATVALNAALDAINLQPGVTLTIDGQGNAIDGGGTQRGLFVYAGSVTLENLAITNAAAVGGAGGFDGAGGGAGLGGGLFVAGTNAGLASGGSVTLDNVTFTADAAIGGAGAGGGGTFEGNIGPYGQYGGGGGLGGAGGDYDLAGGGGGGIGGNAAEGTGSGGDGQPGIVIGAAPGGAGTPVEGPPVVTFAAGGANGGAGGQGASNEFGNGGGGGVGGQDATAAAGGNGGFGGGGGGAGGDAAGNGGFGGGGGSSGGNGGFGGGGGSGGGFGGTVVSGAGGFGAGAGASILQPGDLFNAYLGGGGLGAGGAVFVQQGGSLTIAGGSIAGGTAIGGAGGQVAGFTTPASTNGQGLGAGVFLQGSQTLAFNEAAGQDTVITDPIADQGGNGGAGSLSLSGTGVLDLAATNSFAGGITLQGGTLELAAPNAAGSGTITFAAGDSATLQLDNAALPGGALANAVAGFAAADAIDLPALADSTAATATFDGTTLTVSSGGVTNTVPLSGLPAGQAFQTAPDGQGGTLVTAAPSTPPVSTPPVQTIQLAISEDAWLGDAQFTLAVNGAQVGGVYTSTALHSLNQAQLFTLQGAFGTGPNIVTVNFLNDAYGGTPSTDRNLYVDSIASGGVTAQTSTELASSGPLTFTTPATAFTQPGAAVQLGTGPDQISLGVSEDQYYGDAQFVVDVGGTQIGGVQTATASHAAGQEQIFNLNGAFGPGPQSVEVDFLNDAYGGTPALDRNLYVNTVSAGGVTTAPDAVLFSAGPATFIAPNGPAVLSPTTIGGGTMVFTAPVPQGQTVTLDNQTLQLPDPASFQGTIDPASGTSNEIDLTSLFGAASLVFSPATPDAGTLQVLGAGGQTLAALQLAGSYTASDVSLLAGGAQTAQIALLRPGM